VEEEKGDSESGLRKSMFLWSGISCII